MTLVWVQSHIYINTHVYHLGFNRRPPLEETFNRVDTAKEARLEQSALTVQQLREKLGEWGGSGKKFNQAKTKEDKQVVVLEAYYMKFLHAEPEKQASNEKTPTPKAAVTTSKQSQKEEVPKSVQIETAKNFKADVSSSILSEEPPPLGKILVLEKGWLDKILEGEKTLELRKTLIDERNTCILLPRIASMQSAWSRTRSKFATVMNLNH